MCDWEEEKVKHGAYGNTDIGKRTKTKLPKLNLLEESGSYTSLEETIKNVKNTLAILSQEKRTLSQKLNSVNSDIELEKSELALLTGRIYDL